MGKRLLPILALAAMIFFTGRIYSKEPPPQCAFVSEVSGKAVLARDGKFYLVSGMEGAYCGDVIKVMPGAKVVVADCGNNQKVEIRGPAEFSVEPKQLIFKKGKAGTSAKIDGELCPFFLDEAFAGPALAQVDPDGSNPEKYATFVVKDFSGTQWPAPFSGYIAEIKGEVFLVRPQVLRITGKVVPHLEDQVLSRPDGGFSVYTCPEGKKYRVEGPALIQLTSDQAGNGTVKFLTGKAAKVEEIDREKCRVSYNGGGGGELKPVGLDGK